MHQCAHSTGPLNEITLPGARASVAITRSNMAARKPVDQRAQGGSRQVPRSCCQAACTYDPYGDMYAGGGITATMFL